MFMNVGKSIIHERSSKYSPTLCFVFYIGLINHSWTRKNESFMKGLKCVGLETLFLNNQWIIVSHYRWFFSMTCTVHEQVKMYHSWTYILHMFMNMHFISVHEHAFYMFSWTCTYTCSWTPNLWQLMNDHKNFVKDYYWEKNRNWFDFLIHGEEIQFSNFHLRNLRKLEEFWSHLGPRMKLIG